MSETESELAGVIAHEIGHVVERHGMKQLTKQMGLVMISQLIFGEDPDKVREIISQIILSGVLMKYSRDAEHGADRNAVEITYAAELNPYGMVKFFEELQRQKSQNNSQISAQIQKLTSSHPLTSERISDVKKLISELSPRSLSQRDSQRFLSLKKKLPPIEESDSH
jgi:predicted Zn-dependent protease